MTDAGYAFLAPEFDTGREGFDKGAPQLLYHRVLGDLETPL